MKKWSFKTGDLLSDFNSYEIVYDRTREMLPFNAGDCLKEVTSWFGCMCVVGISMLPLSKILIVKEKFEDTYGVIRIRKSKNRQHNDLKKKYKRSVGQTTIYNTLHIKLKIEEHEHQKGKQFLLH
jgi:hypothetical protein